MIVPGVRMLEKLTPNKHASSISPGKLVKKAYPSEARQVYLISESDSSPLK
jgi:hypothetical protein